MLQALDGEAAKVDQAVSQQAVLRVSSTPSFSIQELQDLFELYGIFHLTSIPDKRIMK